MRIWCGIDWAERHHDIALVDDHGKLVTKRRIADDARAHNAVWDRQQIANKIRSLLREYYLSALTAFPPICPFPPRSRSCCSPRPRPRRPS